MCHFDDTSCAVSGEVEPPLTGLNTPCWWLSLPQMTVLSWSTIEGFGRVCLLPQCFLFFSGSVGAFVIGLSQISSLLSFYLSKTCNFAMPQQRVTASQPRKDEQDKSTLMSYYQLFAMSHSTTPHVK